MRELDRAMQRVFGICACLVAVTATAQSLESTEAVPVAQEGAAQRDCFDFASMMPGTKYELGETLRIAHATITMRDYLGSGAPPETRGAWITKTRLAGGTAPELRTYLINAEVAPDAPVEKVTLNIAEAASGGAAPHANFEVNGERHEVIGGLASINGKVIGKSPAGNAAVSVNLAPAEVGNWNVGTLELQATKGKIESFSFGGVQVFVDNICFTK